MYKNIDKKVMEYHKDCAEELEMSLEDYMNYLEECENMQANMTDEEKARADDEWARSCHDVENHYMATVGHCHWH